MYAGMFYVSGSHYEYMKGIGVKWLFIVIVLLSNIWFLVVWLNLIRIELLKMALRKGKRLFKIASCGIINPDKF